MPGILKQPDARSLTPKDRNRYTKILILARETEIERWTEKISEREYNMNEYHDSF